MSNLPSTFQFRDNWYALSIPPLSTGNAERYMYTMQLMTDCLLEKCAEAQTIRLPGVGDASNLPYLAYDRQLVQGLAETPANFTVRLLNAFDTWALAGSRVGVLGELQAYLQGLQPGVAATLPQMAIVGGPWSAASSWDILYQGDALGKIPTRQLAQPGNFNWDGHTRPWRNWLILYMSLVSSGLSGSAATTGTVTAGSRYVGGGTAAAHTWGQLTTMLVNGIEQQVWIPNTTGTPVNYPWLTVLGLTGLTAEQVGQWITISGSSHAANNGTFPIVNVLSQTSCIVANPHGVNSDSGPLTWSIGYYPCLGPGPVWGAPGFTFGEGELQTPPIDTGSNVGGVWRPTLGGSQPTLAWGLTLSDTVLGTPPPTSSLITSVRQLLQQWKSAGAFYDHIIVAFDGGTGAAGSAFSPNSTPGSGNPGGTFGSLGARSTLTIGGIQIGVWSPTRLISSTYDAYCQGTGSWSGCTVSNVT